MLKVACRTRVSQPQIRGQLAIARHIPDTTEPFPNGKNLRPDDTDNGKHDVVPELDFSWRKVIGREMEYPGERARDGEPTEVLWSAATAREIVADIVQDIELGRMSRAQGLDLIDRVRQRAAPEPMVRRPPTPAREDREGASPVCKVPDGPHARPRRQASDSIRT